MAYGVDGQFIPVEELIESREDLRDHIIQKLLAHQFTTTYVGGLKVACTCGWQYRGWAKDSTPWYKHLFSVLFAKSE